MKKLFLLSILLIFSCDNNEGEISDLKDTVEDLNKQISELQSSQVTSENNSTALQNQVNGLVQKIAALEINSEKYNSEVIGCYRWGDYGLDVLKNGIGLYETFHNNLSNFISIIFVWEKMDNVIKFTFPVAAGYYFMLSNSNGLGHINPGTYEIPLNNLNTLSFPASANNCGTPCTRSFVKYNCPN